MIDHRLYLILFADPFLPIHVPPGADTPNESAEFVERPADRRLGPRKR